MLDIGKGFSVGLDKMREEKQIKPDGNLLKITEEIIAQNRTILSMNASLLQMLSNPLIVTDRKE
jgi:hypothetical protein